ncbi:MAG: DUF364 domain-containing protein [Proteobacteria bacterium]|nr:DUF364 domain-containing protein [Pseudomonadota bacterium]MBU1452671.1 DUF364 domain-containing protein [Pseudomonadota bacterium]MBU2467194.1 DUF364 domain-containing protein [Pseudomonadota bacterium]
MLEPGALARKLTAALAPRAAGRAAKVVVGLVYTAAMLEDGRAGVAYTFRDQAQGACAAFRGLRPLAGQPASDLLALAASRDPIEAAVGLAVAGALLWPGPAQALEGDVLDHLDLGPEDSVGMVGYFGPLVPEVRQRCARLHIFERVDLPQGGLLPQERAVNILPRCQVAMISATTMLNQSLEPLLAACAGCREVVLLGPSTPLCPEVFAGTPVTMLSGMAVRDAPALLRVVAEAGGTRQFSRLADKKNLRLP